MARRRWNPPSRLEFPMLKNEAPLPLEEQLEMGKWILDHYVGNYRYRDKDGTVRTMTQTEWTYTKKYRDFQRKEGNGTA